MSNATENNQEFDIPTLEELFAEFDSLVESSDYLNEDDEDIDLDAIDWDSLPALD